MKGDRNDKGGIQDQYYNQILHLLCKVIISQILNTDTVEMIFIFC